MRTLRQSARINGLDLGRLYGTVDAFRSDPALARFVFRAQNRWLDGPRTQSRILPLYGAGGAQRAAGESFLLDSDSAPVLFGEDRAASALEYLLHALAACLTTTLVAQAAARGVGVDAVETSVEAELDVAGVLSIEAQEKDALLRIDARMVVRSEAEATLLDEAFQATRRCSPVLRAMAAPVHLELVIRS
ncbi:MAG TPA: OsmC family protein [Xanthomonadaceae bacterium]|nr:OsmC family protein [Xanthomonadaceae bacterium]